MAKETSKKEIEEIKRKLDAWVVSPEREIFMKQAKKDAEATKKYLRQARRIDLCDLNKPIIL